MKCRCGRRQPIAPVLMTDGDKLTQGKQQSTKLILWRHGQTDWNKDNKFQGQADVELNAAGQRQAQISAAQLRDLRPAAIYSSPLSRAQQTARKLTMLTGQEPILVDDLQEVNVGSWAGLSFDEVAARDLEFVRARDAGEDYRFSAEGETASEAGRRAAAVLRDIAERHRGQTVVAVSHGLAIRMAIAELLGWDFATAKGLLGLRNAAWAVVEQGASGFKLRAYNQGADQLEHFAEHDW